MKYGDKIHTQNQFLRQNGNEHYTENVGCGLKPKVWQTVTDLKHYAANCFNI